MKENDRKQFMPMATVGEEYDYVNGTYLCKTFSIDLDEYAKSTIDEETTITVSATFVKVMEKSDD